MTRTLLRSWIAVALLPMLVAAAGCIHRLLPAHVFPWHGPLAAAPVANPVHVRATDREFVWLQVVDTVDDYFKIAHEDRVRVVGGVLTEGRIDTFPTVGATVLEPWRPDSTAGFERLHSSLQSIRRRAELRVTPVADGYSIEVLVFKELEDVSRPEHATVGGATLRHDGTLVRASSSPGSEPATLGWIPLGRDPTLEQQILLEIQARASEPGPTLPPKV
jgi:hypothetical protein